MKQRFYSYLSDDFLRHNIIFFLGSMTVAVLNYAYHPIISRLLTVDEFGEVQAYFSLFMQLGIITGIFGRIILNIKANTNPEDTPHTTTNQLYTLSLLITLSIVTILLVGAPYLSALFNLPGYIGLLITALILLISVPHTFAKFSLQAEKKFTQISISELCVAVGKIVFAVLFILLGMAVAGALAGLLVSILVGLMYVYPATKDAIHYRNIERIRITPALMQELRYGFLILCATGFATFLFTADILIVRYFFDAETAGLYAGIATVARIIVFATGSVAGVTIAHVKLNNTVHENHAIMRRALLFVGGMAGSILLFFTLAPQFTIELLMGERFLALAPLLPMLSLLMGLVAVTNLFIMYFLALRRYILIPISFLGALFIATMLLILHNEVQEIIVGLMGGVGIVCVILSILYVLESRHVPPKSIRS